MVNQIQAQDSETQPTRQETAPEMLETSLSDDNDISSDVKEPFEDNKRITTIVVDEQVRNFRNICRRSLYFQVDTPCGRPIKALLMPLIEKTIVSSELIAREGGETAECPETSIKVPWSCDFKSKMTYIVRLNAGSSTVETVAHVVPHFQDGIDVIFGKDFWIDSLPSRCKVENLTKVCFNSPYCSQKPLNIKGISLEESTFSLPLKLPELL